MDIEVNGRAEEPSRNAAHERSAIGRRLAELYAHKELDDQNHLFSRRTKHFNSTTLLDYINKGKRDV